MTIINTAADANGPPELTEAETMAWLAEVTPLALLRDDAGDCDPADPHKRNWADEPAAVDPANLRVDGPHPNPFVD